MFWIRYLVFVAVIKTCWSKLDDINDISDKQPPIKIDDNLRKALLRALTDLETEERAKFEQEISKQSRDVKSSLAEAAFQKAPASTFSIITKSPIPTATTQKPTTTTTKTTTTTTKPIVVIQKSDGIQHRPITAFIPTIKPFDSHDSEQFIASASSSFTASPKFQSKNTVFQARSTSERSRPNLVSITEKPRLRTPEITTPVPVITSSTEENEAKVEDVQFFAAPLVAAFTVHHDEQGLPKSVEPIYKGAGQNSVTTKDVEQRRLKETETRQRKQQEESYKEEQIKLQQYLRHQEQLRLQFDLQEKQRVLEQQIRNLQQQQQQQDYILRQQQLFHEQNLLQQRQRLLEEQKSVLKKQQNSLNPTSSTSQVRFNNQVSANQARFNSPVNQINKPINSNSVTFEPSFTFQPGPEPENNLLKLPVAQQLPIKSAQDFRRPLPLSQFVQTPQTQTERNTLSLIAQRQQLPIKSSQDFTRPLPQIRPIDDFRQPPVTFQQLPLKNSIDFLQPQFTPFQQESPFRKFNSPQPQVQPNFQNFNLVQNNPPQNPQSNRVFRHETGTGNFGNELFNLSPPHFQQSTRFFRSNPESFSITPSVSQSFSGATSNVVRPRETNTRLNNLLYYSGIANGNQQEDLNIVSKVLSLDHFGADNLFGGSQIIEQRLTPPK